MTNYEMLSGGIKQLLRQLESARTTDYREAV